MKIEYITNNAELKEEAKQFIEADLQDLKKYFKNATLTAKVVVKEYPAYSKAEITLHEQAGETIRVEETHETVEAAADLAVKKLDAQIRRIKNRLATSKKRNPRVAAIFDLPEKEEKKNAEITKRKVFENKPMSEEEALLQFELVGHDFFIFDDYEADQTKILYRRKDGEYGIIELES